MLPRLSLLLAAWSLFAQQDTTIRLDVEQVLVPVVVTDKKGHHVSGLRASDFQVFEDGVRQDIAAFSSDIGGPVDDIRSAGTPPQRTGPRHTFVICIDLLHASPASATRIREALENLFDKEKPSDAQYVLIGIGRQLQVLQPATANPLELLVKLRSAAFRNAMGGLDASALSAQLQNLNARMAEFCRRCACSGRQSCDSEIDTLKQSVDAEADRWAAPTNAMLHQFKDVVGELAKLPTGRTLILVSDGFSVNPKREFYDAVLAYLPNRPQFALENSPDADPLREALKIASDRAITIDAIDSRGSAASLAGSGSMDASVPAGGGGNYSVINRPARSARSDSPGTTDPKPSPSVPSPSMEQLARATGGAYFHDSKDLPKQFRSSLADGRQYYVLAYVPKNAAHDGKFRTISVETADKKLTVRAKSGYFAAQ